MVTKPGQAHRQAERGHGVKSKTRGPKHRNLTKRDGVWYYQRVVNGRRVRFSCETGDREAAGRVRDLYEARRGIGRIPAPILDAPTLREFAKRYLEEDTGHLAETTRKDRHSYFREESSLILHFGGMRLDTITSPRLREWWGAEIQGKRSPQTGRHHVNALAAMFDYARDLGLIESSPIPDFRAQLRRRSR